MQAATPAGPSGDFDTGPPFVFGFGFKDGAASEMHWEDLAAREAGYDWVWLHLNMNNVETQRWVRARTDIPYAAREALLAGETRPRVSAVADGLMINLRGVNLNEGADPEDMVSIRVWMSARRIVSTRRRRLRAAMDIRDEILGGRKFAAPGLLVARLAGQLTQRMSPFVEQIDERIDDVEDEMLTGAGERVRARLAAARHEAVLFRRFIAPQREALARLAADDGPLFDPHTRIDLRETADQVTRLTEDIDAARERAMVLQDQLTDQRAEEMNRNMMVLSVVAAIFLPLGFLTGLFGINVGGMPGIDEPAAFWLVLGACAVTGFGLLVIFRIMKWL